MCGTCYFLSEKVEKENQELNHVRSACMTYDPLMLPRPQRTGLTALWHAHLPVTSLTCPCASEEPGWLLASAEAEQMLFSEQLATNSGSCDISLFLRSTFILCYIYVVRLTDGFLKFSAAYGLVDKPFIICSGTGESLNLLFTWCCH